MTQDNESICLAVIDPGLLEPAGHHAGFANVLAASYLRHCDDFEVTVLANLKLTNEVAKVLEGADINVVPFFDVAFYRYFEQAGNAALRGAYILSLSKEYLKAFAYLRQQWGENRVGVLLYHTLSWEHAAALSLAIRQFGEAGCLLQHEVYLMFSPGVDYQGVPYDGGRALNYRVAFSGLSALDNVRLSASCWDYAGAYRYLLDREDDLPIHPCFLADWPALNRPDVEPRKVDLSAARVLLYLGDAKVEKGFLSLPDLVREWQVLLAQNASIVIHYTSCWDNEAFRVVSERLLAMALQDQRIELVNGFLSDNALHNLIECCDFSVVSYDSVAYQYKTSGVLWLFAFYRVALVTYSAGWLSREATRLGMSVILRRSREELFARVERQSLVFERRGIVVKEYQAQLFKSFWSSFCVLSIKGEK